MEGTEKRVPASRRRYETLSESAMKVEGATKEKYEAYRDQVRKLAVSLDYFDSIEDYCFTCLR